MAVRFAFVFLLSLSLCVYAQDPAPAPEPAPTPTPAPAPQDAPSAPAPEPAGHLVPAEKNLSPDFIAGLYARGEKESFAGDDTKYIGMPVGGIGAGQLYLCGDGTLGSWEIFNNPAFTGYGDQSYAPREPKKPVDQGFALMAEYDGRRVVRGLNRHGFSTVTFTGEYPIGRITYQEPDFPIEVEMEAFSPFIPLNSKDSGLPATIFSLKLKNVSDKPVLSGLAAWLENAVNLETAADISGMRRTRVINENGRTLLLHAAEDAPPPPPEKQRPPILLNDFEGQDYNGWTATGDAFGTAPAPGTLPGQQEVTGFEGKGLVNTYLNADAGQGTLTSPPFTINRRFINFLIGGGNHDNETCINLLLDGKVVRTATGKNDEELVWSSWNVAEFDGKQAVIEIADKSTGGWGHINIDQIELSDTRRNSVTGPAGAQADFGTLVLALGEESGDPQTAIEILGALEGPQIKQWVPGNEPYPFPERRNGTLMVSPAELRPGGVREIRFVLAWNFPNAPHGHEYSRRFPDAPAVAHYVFDNFGRLAGNTRAWRDTWYDSTLPYWLLDRIHSTVSTLATSTCQWWRNGRFWAFEGCACCPGTCTHVWNYSHAEARLFPDLTRTVREMQDFAPWNADGSGGGFHPDTGIVGFRSDQNYAADGQCGTILKAYREHCMSPDGAFLGRIWPNVKKTLEYSILQDAGGPEAAGAEPDGLIENSQHNTFDINFEGPNTFVGSLYLAALRAGEEMAREMGDADFADRCRKIFESGSKLSVERLWDGEYFIQQVDLEKFPKHQYGLGCLADQLFGQGWAHQVHLGYLYPPDKVKQALASVWKYDWAPDIGPYNAVHKPMRWFVSPGEAGMFCCTWPKSPYLPEGVIYKDEVWTGEEYQVAGHMIWEGMTDQGLAICRAVHDRYQPRKRNPYNEVECGDHYARAMASWGVLTAGMGFEYHGPTAHIGFAPRITPNQFKCAFTAAEGWGSFSQQREAAIQRDRIDMRWGKLRVKTVALTVPDGAKVTAVTATAAGAAAPLTFVKEGVRVLVTLDQETPIEAGGFLAIELALG